MSTRLVSSSTVSPAWAWVGMTNRAAKAAVLRLAEHIAEGSLTLIDEGTAHQFGQRWQSPEAVVEVLNPDFYRRLVTGGAVGAGEAYMDGLWESPDLYPVIRLLARNERVFSHLEQQWGRLSSAARGVIHTLRSNTLAGSRRNIRAHYDLGNEFFRLWLDPELMYSSAIYPNSEATLVQAARHKLDVVCQRLRLASSEHLLEIGTGWGGLALHAARHYGCRVTTTTISQEQYTLARERVAQAGLGERVTVLLEDYRDLRGTFDKLVSIEMIEAVGDDHLGVFFKACSDRLAPWGSMLLQAITSPDSDYARNKRTVDFVKQYIFPGGQAPSVSRMLECVARHTDLRLEFADDFGRHYARTLLDWRDAYEGKLGEVRQMGYDERFIRMWRFYLNYCAGGFQERRIGVSHLVFSKPRCMDTWSLPCEQGSEVEGTP